MLKNKMFSDLSFHLFFQPTFTRWLRVRTTVGAEPANFTHSIKYLVNLQDVTKNLQRVYFYMQDTKPDIKDSSPLKKLTI